ncbi:glycerol-3-phosphate acyltransferase [Plesiocystis pacifica SIR-1]|uniref:Glycerol-3-phosphate acyltransferase n=1 Tax=Plesiocystis pacifica SIR-1 TaxID=391625 RepID=A6GI87_9BACT|nr:1-acyl-sn-glycerol-3-phosphate acyltransferase [Plesiocystis pacifica]EDM74431.1 glycerol-3-phosphate acyltransferase [Plesiocystis pacifica SIR-1]
MSKPAPKPKTSRVRDLLTKPIRLPQWFASKPAAHAPRIFGFNDERDMVIGEVSARVVAQNLSRGRASLEVLLNETAHHEIARLEKQRDDEVREWLGFWQKVVRKLARMSEAEQRQTLREVVEYMAQDIAGNFDPRVYNFALKTLPGLIAGVMSPRELARGAVMNSGRFALDKLIEISGHVDHFRNLAEVGTMVLVPTHSSNLDSLALGESLARSGLSPAVYGAGKNLFTNPIISFFMHNLGAYRVDRRVKARLYKQVLKAYSCVMIERGYHSLFFPGGTRSRSNMIESRLKLGLAGTGVEAYSRRAVRAKARGEQPRPIFFVPMTINYALVLEAESLIGDYLVEEGRARYIIEDDEFSQLDRWIAFLNRLVGYESACVLRFGRPIDPFGNLVDHRGRSLAPDGRIIDPVRYVSRRGEPVLDPARDAAYTRELGRVIVEHFRRETVIMTTQLVAHVLFRYLIEQTPGSDLFDRMRRRGELRWDHADFVRRYSETRDRLRALADAGEVHMSDHLRTDSAERALERAMGAWDGYHERTVVRLEGEEISLEDPALLLYYQNRLVPWAEGLAGSGEGERAAALEIASFGGAQ